MNYTKTKKTFTFISLLLMLTIFISCGTKENFTNKTLTLKGTISLLKERGASPNEFLSAKNTNASELSRSTGVSDFSNEELNIRVWATLLDSDGEATETVVETSSSLNSKNELTYSLELPQTGKWIVEAAYEKHTDKEAALYGCNEITLNSLEEAQLSLDISLVPTIQEDYTGAIALTFFDHIQKLASLSFVRVFCETIEDMEEGYDCPFSKQEDANGNEVNTALFALAVAPAGHHEVRFDFYSETEEIVYSCKEVVTVFSGFETDSWYGKAPHFSENEETGETEFVITDQTITSFKPVEFLDYPFILWDMTESETKGAAAFSAGQIKEETTLSQGRMLGDMEILDFTIDPVTQKIILFEDTTPDEFVGNKVYQLTEYPTYSGYKRGKTLIKNLSVNIDGYTYPIKKICAYNGTIWAASDGDGQTVILKFTRDNPSQVSVFKFMQDNEEMPLYLSRICMTANENYLYIASTILNREDTSYTYTGEFNLYQFKISEDDRTLIYVDSKSLNHTDILGETGTIESEYTGITDIQAVSSDGGTDIFMLFTANAGGYKRGGIIRYTSTDESLTLDDKKFYGLIEHDVNAFELYECEVDTYFSKHYGNSITEEADIEAKKEELEEIKGKLSEGSGYYLYGPRRFIAKKPDELVIADEGEYGQDVNKNRVYRLNLQDLSFVEATDVNIGFSGYNGSNYYHETSRDFTD